MVYIVLQRTGVLLSLDKVYILGVVFGKDIDNSIIVLWKTTPESVS